MKPAPEQTPSPYFRVGEMIVETGVYRVFHSEHRVSHEVTLLRGEQFPPCLRCGTAVHFELLRAIPTIANDQDFKVRLYAIPHPEEQDANGKDRVA